MALVELNSNNFDEEIKEGIVLVDFYADWCGPCKMIAPFIEQVANESDIKVGKLNVDLASDISNRYDVMSIPTIILFKDGAVVNQKVGFVTKDQILALVEEGR
ncbi:thioredoxin [Erysipelotrichaceae bacterium OttesenSCG-928-M19]|nr:thioredoxin [Erysipelotrichaceae bacterium OttesenSCG-928-M19]